MSIRPGRKAAPRSRSHAKPTAKKQPRTVTAVILDRDVAEHFGDSRTINEVLRALIRLMNKVDEQSKTAG